MTNRPKNKPKKKDEEKESKNSAKWEFFSNAYNVISPFFLPAAGTLFLAALSFYFYDNYRAALAFVCLGICFVLLFVFHLVQSHPFKLRYVRMSIYFVISVSLVFSVRVFIATLSQPQNLITSTGGVQRFNGSDPIINKNQPYVNVKLEKFSIDSARGKIMLNLRLLNASDIPAFNFYRATTVSWDSVPAKDSTWAVGVLKRHLNEGITIRPREIMDIPVEIGGISGPKGTFREHIKSVKFFILGAYSYRDEANNRYLHMYCVNYDPITDYQCPYQKYNINIPVNWQ